ncbi:glycosyltransferase family 32 protein [Sporolactobacillus terrae]|uniref:Mannosyltransferase n=1 Tax=Sporolactobacillus terrae TaxID=269673 RepID=A0ABX5Q4I2_9BACL|nr:glycosyltransferase [Sporolactobacillus terrae]QAA21557.1 mannosyltransferase [Sporolactobacillus terrae]QAA24529.1 mannosyltransferase [Sporolactobacillus terrae]
MIPKIIHYIWIGGKEKPKKVLDCIESWKQILTGYEIKEWNEHNWPIDSNRFAHESFLKRKYAFVSDVIRLDVLAKYGGIYLDSDVLVHKNFDSFLNNPIFLGMMYNDALSTAVIGAEPGKNLIKGLLKLYEDRSYDDMFNGKFDTNNNGTFTRYLIDNYPEFQLKNKIQTLNDGTVIYPKEYFEYPSMKKSINYCEHLFMKSWAFEKQSQQVDKIKMILQKLLGHYLFGKVSSYRGQKRYQFLKEYYRLKNERDR